MKWSSVPNHIKCSFGGERIWIVQKLQQSLATNMLTYVACKNMWCNITTLKDNLFSMYLLDPGGRLEPSNTWNMCQETNVFYKKKNDWNKSDLPIWQVRVKTAQYILIMKMWCEFDGVMI